MINPYDRRRAIILMFYYLKKEIYTHKFNNLFILIEINKIQKKKMWCCLNFVNMRFYFPRIKKPMRQIYVTIQFACQLQLWINRRVKAVKASEILSWRTLQRNLTYSLELLSTFAETIVDVERLTGGNSMRGCANVRVVGRLHTSRGTRARYH